MIQAFQPSKAALVQASEAGVKNSKFGSVLSNTITATNVQDANSDEVNEKSQLQALLEFLQMEDLSQLKDGKELGEDLLFATQDEQVSVIFYHASHVFSAESLEKLQSLLSELTSGTEEKQDILEQLTLIVNQAASGAEPSQQRFLATDEALKLAKIYTLFKNALDLSDENALKLDELKQKLEQIAGKLDSILNSKEKSTFDILMNRHHSTALLSSQIHKESSSKIQSIVNSNGETKIIEGTHNPFMNMSKLEQFVLNTQSGGKGAVNSEQLLKSFEDIISRAKFTNNNGIQKLFIKLNPEHLGSLRVELIQQNGVINAKIIASTAQAKEQLDSQMQGLKQAFINQNIPVEKLELSQQFANLTHERHLARDQGQQQDGQTNSEQPKDDQENINEQFQTQFEEALLEAEV